MQYPFLIKYKFYIKRTFPNTLYQANIIICAIQNISLYKYVHYD